MTHTYEHNETFEAILRLARPLADEQDRTGEEGYITFFELANILNRFRHRTKVGGEYTTTDSGAMIQAVAHAHAYVLQRHGEVEADKISRTIRDQEGNICCLNT